MKRLTYIISVLLAIGFTLPASAVTEKEMQQARTIAAQAYLRYANDGSGYLDEFQAKSMAELERKLKVKEKENIKAFKAIAIPQGYETWDKAKLVDYWANKAFTSSGLVEKGRIGKARARKRISAMTIAPPVKESEKKDAATPAPKSAETAANKKATETASPAVNPPAETAQANADSLNKAEAEAQLLASQALGIDEEEPLQKAENHTWVYIVILCVLVGVVVALVVFASNVMKKNAARIPYPQGGPDKVPSRKANASDASDNAAINAMREKFAAKLTEKNNEIHSLNKKMDDVNSSNVSLKKKVEALTAEVVSLRSRLSDATKTIAHLQNQINEDAGKQAEPKAPVQEKAVENREKAKAQGQPVRREQGKPAPSSQLRTIYLGRANAKGIFIRADRSLNIGNSIYRLDTSDGYAGSFRVASDPTVWEMALLTPRESLSGACVAPDLENTDGMEKIVNDASGTAIFENGCWKVIRKAKIHYE